MKAWLGEDEWPLTAGKAYQCLVEVAEASPDVEPDWGDRDELELLVVAHGENLGFSPPTQRVTLRKPLESSVVEFAVTPRQEGAHKAWFMVMLAREMTLLQEFEAEFEAVADPEPDSGPRP